jgi:hypothetical protein
MRQAVKPEVSQQYYCGVAFEMPGASCGIAADAWFLGDEDAEGKP